ncbi:hypothetical protein HY025_03115 [Candidatus Daviesbacteria bacterium]|nr:hypothetical protein [Candidatus Daviesbacteria bacterium]
MSQKGFAPLVLVLVIVVLFGVGVGGYYFGKLATTNSPQPTSTPTPSLLPTPIATVTNFPSSTPQVFDQTSCQTDNDCILYNSENLPKDGEKWNCCGGDFSCQPIDYSESKWIGISQNWIQQQRDLNCTKGTYNCPMMPMCLPKPINDNYSAKCVNNVCTKTQK